MTKVGDGGIYQWIIFTIIIFSSFVDGIISFTLPLLYLNTELDCSAFGVASTECEHYICEHFSPTERLLYEKEI